MTKAILSYSKKNSSQIQYGIINLENNEITEVKSPFELDEIQGSKTFLDDVKLLPPVSPSKIIAVGLNYKDHAEEFKFDVPEEPLLFIKAPSAIIAPEENIVLTPFSRRVDYEAELVIVIKKTTKDVSEADAKEYILGYTCGNDITARDLQKKDGQWARSKSFDTFAPIGPWVIQANDISPDNLKIMAKKNGKMVQCSNTNQLIFNPFKLVSYISQMMTLMPGDVIFTGTPSGVGPLQSGDCIEIEIEKIGQLRNYATDK